jgi:MFS family permease
MCQWPSAILVQKVGPRIFLPGAVLLWGIIMLCFGFVKNWKQLVALRVLVGIFEAGLLPGTILLLQMWYRRCKSSSIRIFVSQLIHRR